MVRASRAIWRIAMARHHYPGLHLRCAGEGGLNVVELEPEQNPVSVRTVLWVTNSRVLVFDVPAVQLKD
jgi:hypothetical protein